MDRIIFVFDFTSKYSFDNINIWYDDAEKFMDNPILILFGKKTDEDEKKENSQRRNNSICKK